jgi:hypothetical protein
MPQIERDLRLLCNIAKELGATNAVPVAAKDVVARDIPSAARILINFGVVIAPAVGAILMSLSTVLVAINSQTFRRYGPKTEETVTQKNLASPHEHRPQ